MSRELNADFYKEWLEKEQELLNPVQDLAVVVQYQTASGLLHEEAHLDLTNAIDLIVKMRINQAVCPHSPDDRREIGSAPGGSFTIVYYVCTRCGRKSSND
jgi:transposase-like protein